MDLGILIGRLNHRIQVCMFQSGVKEYYASGKSTPKPSSADSGNCMTYTETYAETYFLPCWFRQLYGLC